MASQAPKTDSIEVPEWLMLPLENEGLSADQANKHGHVEGLIDGIAGALAKLHKTPLSGSTVDGWQDLAVQLQTRVDAGEVDTSQFPDPYSRYEAERLLEIWIEAKPATSDVVLCHGNPRLASFFFDGPTMLGTNDVSSLRIADRHLDLAIIHHEIHHQFGPEAVYRLYESYGQDPDLVRLDHYILASLLLGQ